MALADVGLVGLAVMGRNLVLNLNDHGYRVAVFNRSLDKTEEFLAGDARGTRVVGTRSLRELVATLERPRKIILMVKAGQPVDALLGELTPLLEAGDIVIDAGNSHYADSARRLADVEGRGLRYVAMGVSGGEEGARRGPSLMPGGSASAWPELAPMLKSIAAKVDGGTPCCEWVGPAGAGHFVKMVHNGIEYGDMQIIAEAYHLMRDGLRLDNPTMAAVFASWNRGELESFLIEITQRILEARDAQGAYVVDGILDTAGQKGTGRWTVEAALELGVALPLITESVFSRALAADRDGRESAGRLLGDRCQPIESGRDEFVTSLAGAVYSAKIVSYAQGFMLMAEASRRFGWNLDLGGVALLWRGGCIIRSRFLGRIFESWRDNPSLSNLLLAPFFTEALQRNQAQWRYVTASAVMAGIPVPAISSALSFFDGFRSRSLPANLLQAQRDLFGAHTFERLGHERGRSFHALWDTHPVSYQEAQP